MTSNLGHLLSRDETVAPGIPGEFLAGAGFFVSLLVACYGRDLAAGLFRSLLTSPQAAWMSCNVTRSDDAIPS